MDANAACSYRFNSFLLDIKERQLSSSDAHIPLTPKVFDVLVYLVTHGGHLVHKDELMQAVWPDSFVDEVNLPRTIHTLRKVLGDDGNGNKFIETVPTKGYRFVAKVTEVHEPAAPESRSGKRNVSTVVEYFPETLPQIPPRAIDESDIPPVGKQKHATRVILFTVGFATAVFLIVLLSFNFRSGSSINPNDVKSIAVLPIKPLTAETREPIYELGIADSLILKLSSIKNLIVRPLTATRRYADIEQDALAAGREQQVDYVLASNYHIADGKIRITSQLYNVQSGQVDETFKDERENSNRFAVQDAVAANIGQSLLRKLNRESNNLSAKSYTTNEAAYRLYLLGSALADKRGQIDVRKAIDYFEQAVRLDPNYALAYAGLANAQMGAALNNSAEPQEQYLKARVSIERALAIDDNLAEAHSYLGELKTNYDWDFAGAEREHKRAIELNPNSAAAHRMYALLLGFLGRPDESIAEIKTAIDLEPASVLNHNIYGEALFFARRYDDAITELERSVEMDPEFYFNYIWLSLSYHFKGNDDKAFESFLRMRTLAGEEPAEIDLWKTIYAKSGWLGIYKRQFEQEKETEKKGNPDTMQLAIHSTELGQREQAIAYLEKAIGQREWGMIMLKVNPRFDLLRSDPRFNELVRRVGLN